MKICLGQVSDLSEKKTARVICESHKPEIFGVIGGVIITLFGRHLYKRGSEDAINSESRALAEIGAIADYDPKKNVTKAKVLK